MLVSIFIVVLFEVVTPPYIEDVAGGSVRSGLGFLLEMTCTVRGHPAPKVSMETCETIIFI